MSCYHPLKGFVIGEKKGSPDKKDIKLCTYKVDHIEKLYLSNSCIPVYNKEKQFSDALRIDDYIEIPCGHCVGCRLDYARVWSCRILCELDSTPSDRQSFFVTLTYDDDHVPMRDSNFDDCPPELSLYRRDLTLFFKRLRKAFPDARIRYYACGEYGSRTFRPHYHAVIFDLPLEDLEVVKVVDGNFYYHSDTLDAIWSKGYCSLGNVTPESAAYTARYCVKKAFGVSADSVRDLGIEPEFVTMSRRPGIGAEWLDSHAESFLQSPQIVIGTDTGAKKFTYPRYFLDRFAGLTPENSNFVELVKEANHNKMINQRLLEDMQTSCDFLTRLADEERRKIKNLKKERDFDV